MMLPLYFQEMIETLNQDFSALKLERATQIKFLESEMVRFNKQFFKIRKTLHNDLKTDNAKLRLLTNESYRSLHYIKNILDNGEVLKMLIETCRKYETERERVSKWLPITFKFLEDKDEDTSDVEESYKEIKLKETVEDTEELSVVVSNVQEESATLQTKTRPKTAFHTKTMFQTPTPEPSKISTVDNITLQAKALDQPSTSLSSSSGDHYSPVDSSNIIQRCVDSLKNMDNFWINYNNVEVDYLEISEEKRILEKENKQLKEMIRAVLESAALSKSIPSSKVSTRLPSRRNAYSAVSRRIVI